MPTALAEPTALSIAEQRILQITEFVGAGWQLQRTAIAREVQRWPQGRARVFEFVLCSREGRQLAIAVPDDPAVEHFLQLRELDVLDL